MSLRLKAATVAALSFSALAALWASERGLAEEASIALSSASRATNVKAISAPMLTSDANIAFAPSREIVQPLNAGNSQSVVDDIPTVPSLDAMVEQVPQDGTISDEMRCLATAVYFESKGESLAGQLAVARVVINRAHSRRFADSLCGVVLQPSQFSFVRRGIMPAANTTSRDWREALAIARIALENRWESSAEGALYFHARRVSPAWKKQRIAAIDNHIFYR